MEFPDAIEHREAERRAIVRRAIDFHEAHCPCGEARRNRERRIERQPNTGASFRPMSEDEQEAEDEPETRHAWEWRALERENQQ